MFTKSVPATMKMKVKGGAAVDPDSGKKKYPRENLFIKKTGNGKEWNIYGLQRLNLI